MAIRYWLLVHPLDRARELMESGHARVAWSGPQPVSQFREADGVVLYSPRTHNPEGEPLRAAVGAGRVTGEPYQLGGHGTPRWVAPVDWLRGARIAPIRPLRDMLELTRDSSFWGEQLRDGWVELSPRDFMIFEDAVRPVAPEPSGLGVEAMRDGFASPTRSAPPVADTRARAEQAWRDWDAQH